MVRDGEREREFGRERKTDLAAGWLGTDTSDGEKSGRQKRFCYCTTRGSNLGTVGSMLFCCGGLSCRMFTSIPASSPLDASSSRWDNKNIFKTLPSVPCGAKSPLVENHWCSP